MKLVKQWLGDRAGATVVEYGLIVAAIALAAVVGLGAVGNGISSTFERAGNKITQASK